MSVPGSDDPSRIDPLRSIEAALLNSADIRAYQHVLSQNGLPLLEPFNDRFLKSASYEIPFCGKVIYWQDRQRYEQVIKENDYFVLQRNTIVFFEPAVKFCLPDYLAVRFNLAISMIHKGLLLGTGPLVDPGFEGHLLIPLHNLTTNAYTLSGKDGLIWVEFTKISKITGNARNEYTDLDGVRFSTAFEHFPPAKKNQTADQYLAKATGRNSIESSLNSLITRTEQANRKASRNLRLLTIGGAIALASLIFGAGAMLVSVIQLNHDVEKDVQDARVENHKTDYELKQLAGKVDVLNQRLDQVTDVSHAASPKPGPASK